MCEQESDETHRSVTADSENGTTNTKSCRVSRSWFRDKTETESDHIGGVKAIDA